jgi:hypothetical protein
MRDLVERERMHRATVRQLDDMCRVVEVLNTMKPGDRVIWLYSAPLSFLSGRRRQEVPGVIVRVCTHRIRIRVQMGGVEKLVSVDRENVIWEQRVEMS